MAILEYLIIGFIILDLILYISTPYKFKQNKNHNFKFLFISGYILFILWIKHLIKQKHGKQKI